MIKIFGIFKDLEKIQNRVALVKLQKKNDISYEVECQTSDLVNNENMVLEILIDEHKTIILFQDMHGISDFDEFSIDVRLRVITSKGVIIPDPKLYASIRQDNIQIVDIAIFGKNQNNGYGSILINKLKEIALNKNISKITGNLSSVDSGHIDRQNHFYKKNGLEVNESTGLIELTLKQ
ncbi:GNAT family N-acetyltransferase [Bacillus sp. FJAT-26390]|uniref:GNAT family N-acetyltransferase n=1 Tax=Bacillus sp. FJAT-26390 TaxID=1743142 RepID=UPI000807D447|nr:GNAT family N-acetyltransferase [Bacillus sp. FJAT-26390]OBZ10882.1 hypothetical protein A7975_17930 [Bacillus sp. FJAT-26390]